MVLVDSRCNPDNVCNVLEISKFIIYFLLVTVDNQALVFSLVFTNTNSDLLYTYNLSNPQNLVYSTSYCTLSIVTNFTLVP